MVDRWSDDRLDELNRRLINVENVREDVAVVKTRLTSMETALSRANDGIEKLSTKLGQVVDEPMVRARDFRRQVTQGLIAAIAGGILVFGFTLLAGVVH